MHMTGIQGRELREKVETLDSKITEVFKTLRKMGIYARKNFSCCSSCGSYEIGDMKEKGKLPGYKGYTFYNQQSTESFNRHGSLYLQYGSLDDDTTAESVADQIVLAFVKAGVKVEWNGDANQCVKLEV